MYESIAKGKQMEELIEFWKLALKLKEEPRRGWIQRLKLSSVESVADHSYAVALLALYEASRRGYDVGKTLKLALVHDLEEAITGDMTPLDKRGKSSFDRIQRKRLAIETILGRMPTRTRKQFRSLWADLLDVKSREARLVKDLDRMEMALQAAEYERKGAGRTKVSEFYRSALREIKDPEFRKIVTGLMVARPR